MEIKIVLDKKDLGDYTDYRFTIYRDGKEGINIWTGEAVEYWDWTVDMIINTVRGILLREKPEKEK